MQFVQDTKMNLLLPLPACNRGSSLTGHPLTQSHLTWLLLDQKYLPISNLSLLHTLSVLLFPPAPAPCLHFWLSMQGLACLPPPLGTRTMGRISPAPVAGWGVVMGARDGFGCSGFLKQSQCAERGVSLGQQCW